jgi:hypothetical protein
MEEYDQLEEEISLLKKEISKIPSVKEDLKRPKSIIKSLLRCYFCRPLPLGGQVTGEGGSFL